MNLSLETMDINEYLDLVDTNDPMGHAGAGPDWYDMEFDSPEDEPFDAHACEAWRRTACDTKETRDL